MGPFDVVGLALVCLAMVKIIQAVSHAIVGRRDASHVVSDPELLAEVDALKTRLAEVEERLDFAERLLARADTAGELPGRVER